MTIKWRGRTRPGDVPDYPRFVDTATNIAADPSTTQVGPTATIVPPTGSMVPGDLVVVHCYYRGAATNWRVATTGGQQWTAAAKHTSTTQTVQVFYCKWNGTWDANPAFDIASGTETMIAVMSVFRSPNRDDRWAVDQIQLNSGAGTAFTIASVTPNARNTVAIACVASQDDNSYGLSATTWSQLGLAQYRSSGGTDAAMALAFKTQREAQATGPLTLTQTALGADAGITLVVVFKSGQDFEIGAISARPRTPLVAGPKRLRGSPRTYTDAVTVFDQTLTANLYNDSTDTFYSATVSQGGAQTLTAGLYDDSVDTFYSATISTTVSLTPNLYTNSPTFPTHALTLGTVTLTPSLYTNSQTFPTHSLALGTVTLTPGLYTNSPTFPTHSLTLGTVSLTPSLYTDPDTFYSATVTTGPVTSTVPFFDESSDTFYAATINQGTILNATRYDNTSTFNSAGLTLGPVTLTAGRYDNSQTFFGPTISAGVATLTVPLLDESTDTFYNSTISQPAAGAQTLDQTALFSNVPVIYSAEVRKQYPDPAQVQLGVVYGQPGLWFTGTSTKIYDGSLKLDLTSGKMVKPLTNKVVISL